jgi:hypothetical protein
VRESNRDQTREELHSILERYPPEVGRVLMLDPTLLRNESWLATYPALAGFLTAHPEVAHSPGFFLEHFSLPGTPPPTATERLWSAMMESFVMFTTITIFMLVAMWFARTIIEHRRWSRMSRMQAEVHTKLMDRLTGNEELLAYIQTPAGKKFLESAPIQLDSVRSVSAPVGRILWSVQIGLVVAAAGIGLLVIAASVEKELVSALYSLGILAISIGGGFVLSAVVSFLLSKRFGLLENGQGPQSEPVG